MTSSRMAFGFHGADANRSTVGLYIHMSMRVDMM
jgi:hypothetical protein